MRYAYITLEVFPKKRDIWEVERVGDLLNGQVGGFELRLRIHDHHVGDDVRHGAACFLLHDHAEMLGRDAEVAGIKGSLPVGDVMLHHQTQELLLDLVAAGHCLAGPLLSSIQVANANHEAV